MSKLGIVVIGYNRPKSIERILNRLSECEYGTDEVTLFISLDNCGNDECVNVCENFHWNHGEMRIITHEKRMGLKNHILSCGDLLLSGEFDALAYFEDDIYPARLFYPYFKAAYEKYCDVEQIAGISFYSPSFMTNTDLSFEPQRTLYDVYFMQVAQSWGEAWTVKQWRAFREWYDHNSDEWSCCNALPTQIGLWGKNSWLKYYMRYCAEEKKYFVYPYTALSTCYSETGQHTVEASTMLQRTLLVGCSVDFRMPTFSEDSVRYDAFYENENVIAEISKRYHLATDEITVDIYGTKPTHKRYWLTTRVENYSSIATFSLSMKPHEMNAILNTPGYQIHLYDTNVESNENNAKKITNLQKYEYYDGLRISKKNAFKLCCDVCIQSLRRFIRNKRR